MHKTVNPWYKNLFIKGWAWKLSWSKIFLPLSLLLMFIGFEVLAGDSFIGSFLRHIGVGGLLGCVILYVRGRYERYIHEGMDFMY